MVPCVWGVFDRGEKRDDRDEHGVGDGVTFFYVLGTQQKLDSRSY